MCLMQEYSLQCSFVSTRCRALRVVNPSPYMIYLQARGSILVASSPEILCHVSEDRTVTNRSALALHVVCN